MAIDPERLQGRWVHSHEEDTDDEIVYRSASSGYDFPRSRGREALELHADGSYGGVVPGPTDKPEQVGGGTWTVEEGNKLVLPDRTLEVVEADEGVLRVKRPR
jgi:hypothetical protein